jgi:hypothetical protein
MGRHAPFPWRVEFNSTADLARRALIAVGGAIACAIVEVRPNGDHAELDVEHAGRDALRGLGASVSGRRPHHDEHAASC